MSVYTGADQLQGDDKENLLCVIGLKDISTAKRTAQKTHFPTMYHTGSLMCSDSWKEAAKAPLRFKS